jgi:hypothetical protein
MTVARSLKRRARQIAEGGEPDGAELVTGRGLDDGPLTAISPAPGTVKDLALPPLLVKECHTCSYVV